MSAVPPTIEKVALVGASGNLGSYFASALLAAGKHVTALTRGGASKAIPAGATTVAVNYDDEPSLVAALQGHHALIITLSVQAPTDVEEKLTRAAGQAGVALVMPNAYGNNIYNPAIDADIPIYQGVHSRVEALRKIGPAILPVVCGFWYEYSLTMGEPTFGIDIKARKAVLYDDGKTNINVSTWNQCGRAVAALMQLPRADVVEWARTHPALYFSSFKLSQRDILDSLHRVLGTKDQDWTITQEPSKERWARGMKMLDVGDWTGIAMAMYARTMFPNGDGIFESLQENAKLGLPTEDLDEATKRAVDMVESDYNPFG